MKPRKYLTLRHILIDPEDQRLVADNKHPLWPWFIVPIVVLCIIAAIAVNFN